MGATLKLAPPVFGLNSSALFSEFVCPFLFFFASIAAFLVVNRWCGLPPLR